MNHQIPIVIGLLAIGVVLGATITSNNSGENNEPDHPKLSNNSQSSITTLQTTESPSVTTETNALPESAGLDDIKQVLQTLQQQLQQEITKRKQLEQKVAVLVKELTSNAITAQDPNQNTGDNESASTSSPHQSGSFNQNTNWFNEQAMLDAGVDSAKVSYIKSAFEQAEMDKLYLRDQATREGWLNSERYSNEAKAITDRTAALRNQLSETEYDAYLYAAGRSNRVMVESVLSTSPASNAGILPGDTIIKYGDKRIYSWTDLTSATSEGAPNDTVSVTIERNGQTQQVYLPRGPLGVRLTTDSVAP